MNRARPEPRCIVSLTTLLAITIGCHDGTPSMKAGSQSVLAGGSVSAASSPSRDIWIDRATIAGLPDSGAAWSSLAATAASDCGTPDLTDQEQSNNVCIMAKALFFARTGSEERRNEVVSAIRVIAQSGKYHGRALALGRELAAYVIAADLVDLPAHDRALDDSFRAKLIELRRARTEAGPSSLIECHENRPNNWGTHCGASRAAIAAYLGDREDLDRVARVFKGWLGDRSAYSGFSFSGDRSWHCNPKEPRGINPQGCVRNGYPLDGVLPDDQRRGGAFAWPPRGEPYVYEALQGALAQAVILDRQGHPAFQWSDKALLRAFSWLNDRAGYPAAGDDEWQPHVINHYYGTRFPAPVPARPGKNVGWTDWTHAGGSR